MMTNSNALRTLIPNELELSTLEPESARVLGLRAALRVLPALALPIAEDHRQLDTSVRTKPDESSLSDLLLALARLKLLLSAEGLSAPARHAVKASLYAALSLHAAIAREINHAVRFALHAIHNAHSATATDQLPVAETYFTRAFVTDFLMASEQSSQSVLERPLWPENLSRPSNWSSTCAASAKIVRGLPWPPTSLKAATRDEFVDHVRAYLAQMGGSIAPLPGEMVDFGVTALTGEASVVSCKFGEANLESAVLDLLSARQERGAKHAILFTSRSIGVAVRQRYKALGVDVVDALQLSTALAGSNASAWTARVERPTTSFAVHAISVQIEGYRGIQTASLVLDNRTIALVGINGAGKSSLISAAGTGLQCISVGQSERVTLTNADVRTGSAACRITMSATVDGRPVSWALTCAESGKSAVDTDALTEALRPLNASILNGDGPDSPVFVLYPTEPTTPKSSKSAKAAGRVLGASASSRGRSEPRAQAPFHFSYESFTGWFRLLEDYENQVRARQFKEFTDRTLGAVRQALALVEPSLADLHYDRKKQSLCVKMAHAAVAVDQLSDGERRLFTLVADIAARLCACNPFRPNPLDGHGVVLIDEVELHLHPSWQRKLVPRLLSAFPGCMFLFSTHSPLVLSAVPHSKTVFLRAATVAEVPNSPYGRDMGTVLRDFMGVEPRPDEIANRIRQISDAIDKDDFKLAKQSISDLVSVVGSDDPEVIRLQSLLHFLGS